MAATSICATFLIMRLRLNCNEEQMVKQLCNLFDAPGRRLFLRTLIKRFGNNPRLVSILGSWVGPGVREILTIEDLYCLAGRNRIQSLSVELGVDNRSLADAFSEIFPVLIHHYLAAEALASDVSPMQPGGDPVFHDYLKLLN